MRINSINFGMKYTPSTEVVINAAKIECRTDSQKEEFQKCINFLEKTFPQKTLDMKTDYFMPESFIEKIFGKKGYYDKIYINDKPVFIVKMSAKSSLARLISLSNGILIHCFSDVNHFPFISDKKFLG